MKVKEVQLKNFKRFTDLHILGLAPEAKLVIVVGPNGSGKSSLFDAFNHYYRTKVGWGWNGDIVYTSKNLTLGFDYNGAVKIKFYDHEDNLALSKNNMYFRSAYRHEPDFEVKSFSKMPQPQENLKINRLIDSDQTVRENYQRLLQQTMESLYDSNNNAKTVEELRHELIGKIQRSFNNIFPDLILHSISDPFSDKTFTFKKGNVDNYPYKNLSAGEKAVFDLLLDLHVKSVFYNNTIYMIDEPELHIHTSLQAKLIDELYQIIPDNSQLWINTHSLGIMQKAKEISVRLPDTVNFIDFHVQNFDEEVVLYPTSIDKVVWEKFLSVALGEMQKNFAPANIVICEGTLSGNGRKGFDASIYTMIMSRSSQNIAFVSGGGCNDIVKSDHAGAIVLASLLTQTKVIKLLDRDDRSSTEVEDLLQQGICVTSRRNLEAYILDDEVLKEYLISIDMIDRLEEVLQIKADALHSSIQRGNPSDDLKSASGEFFTNMKKHLGLTRIGNNADAFMKDTLAPIIKPGMGIFEEIEIMFSSILNNS